MNIVRLYDTSLSEVSVNKGVRVEYFPSGLVFNPKPSFKLRVLRAFRKIEGRLCDWTGYNNW